MKNEYIRKQDAVDALKAQADTMRTWVERYAEQRRGILTAVNIVDDIKPAADVVPVVRCENCIHWSDSNQCARPELSGSRWHGPKYFDTYPDDFCSYGERSKQE